MADGAEQLAAEIKRDLPFFTRHDRAHHDALWDLVGRIAGPKIKFRPSEGFVLGASILLHDLGLGLAAYPDGPKSLQEGAAWADAVALAYRSEHGRLPTPAEIADPDPETCRVAMGTMLIESHAARAEDLASISWKAPHGGRLYLIEDADIRQAFGRIVGRVAHSHWWSPDRLFEEFAKELTAPSWLPADWGVDPLKLACLLRTADAAHLDAGRAPSLMYAIRRPHGLSRDHWSFQNRLHQPAVKKGRLHYTSGSAFPSEEIDAWWLCYELLRNCNTELQAVDALLADNDRARFQARGVAGIENPKRLARLIETDGWQPLDASPKVSNVSGLVSQMGGVQLYGRDKLAALRELIQNAIDAIQARRIVEQRSEGWGNVVVRLCSEDDAAWLEVEDNGIGMSPRVMTTSLVDFGNSFWKTTEVTHELPGLVGGGFQPIGSYGIGFNAVFMLGAQVSVISRRADAARSETYVLDFRDGLEVRPIPRVATAAEQIQEGGTLVRVLLDAPLRDKNGLLHASRPNVNLDELCGFIAPASEVTIEVEENGRRTTPVKGGDWRTLDPNTLLRRIADPRWELRARAKEEEDAPQVTPIVEADGTVVGRCAMGTTLYADDAGVVTVGGLRSIGLKQMAGLVIGRSERAARDIATPVISRQALKVWADAQAAIMSGRQLDERQRRAAAWSIHLCGGDPRSLPICQAATGPLSYAQFIEWASGRDEVLVVGENVLYQDLAEGAKLELTENTVASPIGIPMLLQGPLLLRWPLQDTPTESESQTAHPIHSALIKAWGSPDHISRTSGKRTSTQRVATTLNGQPVPTTGYQLYLRRNFDIDANSPGSAEAENTQSEDL